MTESARSAWGADTVVSWVEGPGLTNSGRHAAAAGVVALILSAFIVVGLVIDPDAELLLAFAIPLLLIAFALTGSGGEELYLRAPITAELSLDADRLRLTKVGGRKPQVTELAAIDAGQLVLRYLPAMKNPRPLRLELHRANKQLVLSLDELMVADPGEPGSKVPLATLLGAWWPKPSERRQRAVGFFWAGPAKDWVEPIPAVFAERLAQDPIRLRLSQPTMRFAVGLTVLAAVAFILPDTRALSIGLLAMALVGLMVAHQLVQAGRR
jgi:hypothetical protein